MKYRLQILILCLSISLCSFGQNPELRVILSDSTSFIQNNLAIPYSKHHQNLKSLQQELTTFNNELERNGFLSHKTDSVIKKNNYYSYYITAGKKTNEIIIQTTQEIQKLLKLKDTIIITKPETLEETLKKLTQLLDNRGETFTQIKLINQQTKNNTLYTDLILYRTETRTIDSIVISGYENFPKSFLTHYAGIRKKALFSKYQIEQKASNLNSLAFIQQNKPPEILFSKDSTTLFLYLEKKNVNIFDGFIGFNTDEETNNLKFNGSVNLQLINTINSGEEIKIFWKNNGNKQSSFLSSIKVPYPLKLPITPGVSLGITKQDTLFNNTTLGLTTDYQISTKHKFGLFYRSTNSVNTLSNHQNLNITNYRSHFIGITYNLNNTYITNPFLKTSEIIFNLGTGIRKTPDTKNAQQILEIDAYHQFGFTTTLKLFVNNQTRTLLSKKYYDNENYFFGGINSVRGFEENSLSSPIFNTLNMELRKLLSSRIYLHTITDLCVFKNTRNQAYNTLYGLGIGIGILNKNGYFKLNYAIGLSADNASNLNNSKIHVSYSTFF